MHLRKHLFFYITTYFYILSYGFLLPSTFVINMESSKTSRFLSRYFELHGKSKKGSKKTKLSGPITAEFSRVVNVDQIPPKRPVLCRIIAKENERIGLAQRFDIEEITYFGANITLSRHDENTIFAEGNLKAVWKAGATLDPDTITCDFDTTILDTKNGDLNFEEEMDYDDEIRSDGNIDIGEIASQYLSLEII